MDKKERLLKAPLNIQLFGATKNVELTEGEQAKYVNNIMRALGQTNAFPLQQYMAKSASNNAAYSVFYVAGTLTARNREANVDTANQNFKDVKGVANQNLLTSIRVYPTEMEVPLWVDDRDFDKSQLNEQSALQVMQKDAIYRGCDERIANLLKDIYKKKKRTVKNSAGTDTDIAVPTTNYYGDKAKPFSDPVNVRKFRNMMRKAMHMAKANNLKIGIVCGDEGNVELADCEKFSQKDWVNVQGETTVQSGSAMQKLLGGNVEELWTFDDVFYGGSDKVENGVIAVIIQDCLGQDNKKASIKPIIEHVSYKKAYYMDVEVSNATELINGQGIFFFEYSKTTPAAAAKL